jgi:hypothetical protein
MRVLEYFFKTKIVFLASLFLFISCRKEIEHKEGVVTSIEVDTNLTIQNQGWIQISEEGLNNFNALEVFNGELYVGGQFVDVANNIRYFAKLGPNNKLVPAAPLSFGGEGIYDLEVYNNELIIGGNFYYGSVGGNADLIRMNSSGTITDIPFSNSIGSRVRCIHIHQNQLYIGGIFSSTSTNAIVSSNVERLVNYMPVGTANVVGEVFSLASRNSYVYACGPTADLQVWNGTTWSAYNYNNQNSFDEVYSIFNKNGEIYIIGYFHTGNVTIKKLGSLSSSTNITDVRSVGKMSDFSKMKEISGIGTFLMGNSYSLNSGPTNSIISLNGSDWYVGYPSQLEVRDIEIYNNEVYIATKYGVFKKV